MEGGTIAGEIVEAGDKEPILTRTRNCEKVNAGCFSSLCACIGFFCFPLKFLLDAIGVVCDSWCVEALGGKDG